jgi:hypothetical protein
VSEIIPKYASPYPVCFESMTESGANSPFMTPVGTGSHDHTRPGCSFNSKH